MGLRMPECSDDFYKYGRIAAIAATAVFLAIGFTFLGVGLWFVLDPDVLCFIHVSELNARGDIGRAIAYCLAVLGACLIITCIIGLVGLILKHPYVLMVYMVGMCVLALFQFIIAILAFINSGWLDERLRTGMYTHMRTDFQDRRYGIDDAWNRMQIQLRCCGTINRDDWVNSSSLWYTVQGQSGGWAWPPSCCYLKLRVPGQEVIDEIGCRRGDRGSMHVRGCYPELEGWLYTWSVAIGVSLFLLVFVMAGLIATSGFLWKEYWDKWHKVAPKKAVKPVKHPKSGEMEGNYWKNSRPLPKHADEITPVYT